MKKAFSPRVRLILAMVIYGTISLVVRRIPLTSGVIAGARSLIGGAFLLLVMAVRRKKPAFAALRKNALFLLPAGIMLGFNWILLFEAYRYTSVAVATLCYYMSPVLILLVSPLLLHERLTGKKLLCVLAAFIGMSFVSGVAENGMPTGAELRGVLLGLAAAVLYAGIILLNKKLDGVSGLDRTFCQLMIATVVLLPYNILSGGFSGMVITPDTLLWLLIAGIIYTGLAYYLYFGALDEVSAQTAAMLSYIDPVVAVIVSVCILREGVSLMTLLGAALILGAAIVSERE